jgi:hypothetical protein
MPLVPRFVLCSLVMALCFTLSGCGVQSGEKTVKDCDALRTMGGIKQRMDALDRKITDLRPQTITAESIKSLVPVYRRAVSTYDALFLKASAQLALARSEGRPSDITGAWLLMTDSLKFRRDGMRFFAKVFAHPEIYFDRQHNAQTEAQTQALRRRQKQLNSRLTASIVSLYSNRGFKRWPDGQFVIDC